MRLDNGHGMLKDLRHAIRVLTQAKGWTVVVVLSLAVGIGANAAVFTAVNGLLLRNCRSRIPIRWSASEWGGKNDMHNDSSDYGNQCAGRRRRAGACDVLVSDVPGPAIGQSDDDRSRGHAAERRHTVTIDGRAETASTLMATGNYHALLGVTPRIGRTLAPG